MPSCVKVHRFDWKIELLVILTGHSREGGAFVRYIDVETAIALLGSVYSCLKARVDTCGEAKRSVILPDLNTDIFLLRMAL